MRIGAAANGVRFVDVAGSAGISFNYHKGEWMGIQMVWHDARRVLSLSLARGSRMLPPSPRNIEVKLGQITRAVVFDGKSIEVSL